MTSKLTIARYKGTNTISLYYSSRRITKLQNCP